VIETLNSIIAASNLCGDDQELDMRGCGTHVEIVANSWLNLETGEGENTSVMWVVKPFDPPQQGERVVCVIGGEVEEAGVVEEYQGYVKDEIFDITVRDISSVVKGYFGYRDYYSAYPSFDKDNVNKRTWVLV
jgi:hypothetical protein